MKNYDDYLAQLPFGGGVIANWKIMQHPLFISFDDEKNENVAYFKINDTEACAVVMSHNDPHHYIRLEKEINGHTLRLVYLWSAEGNAYDKNYVFIPETVWSIYGAENWTNPYYPPFVFETKDRPRDMEVIESQYFKYVEFDVDNHIYWLISADGEDVIYGVCNGNIDAKLEGVKTIHCIRQLHRGSDSAKISIPSSVEKIKKLHGDFTVVTFEGVLPVFCEESLKEAEFNLVKVLTPFDMSPRKSVDILLRERTDVLFAAHALTQKIPEPNGYIALTNARFDCDGQTILVNTPWIATICPKSYLRSDGEVKGAVVLIGLKDSRQEHGVAYDVYESPEIIEGKIVDAQL